MNELEQLVQRPALPPYIRLFTIDLTPIGLNEIYRYTSMTGGDDKTVLFNGHPYAPFPIAIEGVDKTSSGAPPRATLVIANILDEKLFGTLAFTYNDIVGAKVIFTRTFSYYLGLDSSVSIPPLRYTISQKLNHDNTSLSFQLRSALDKENQKLPNRQMLRKDFPGLSLNRQ